jgi:hypothetical protein
VSASKSTTNKRERVTSAPPVKRKRERVMKNKEQIEAEIEKVILEMQEIRGEDEGWDTRNGWVNALRWTLKEGESE